MVNRKGQVPLLPGGCVARSRHGGAHPHHVAAAWTPRLTLAAAAVLVLIPGVVAHGGGHGLDEQLVADGKRLLLGEFTAPQRGPLVVVPYTEGPLGCAASAEAGYRIAMSDDVGVMFAANETRVQILVDRPAGQTGYVGFAADTHDATRALLMMQENAVALHALVGVVHNDTTAEARTGTLGVPYPLGDGAGPAHGHGHDDTRMMMAHDGAVGRPVWCEGPGPGQLVLAFNRTALPESLAPGMLVHVVALVDARFAQFLPRVIPDSTSVLEANLYLARLGEDPTRVRAALDPSPSVHDAVPAALAVLGVALVALPVRGRR